MSYVVLFEQLRMTDVDSVGGKNASLGEMISQLSGAGVRVPGGFATTADAFRDFLKASGLDKRIAERLTTLNPEDVRELANAGAQIRQWIIEAPFSTEFETQIRDAFAKLDADGKGSFAVRSSATAEDLPDAAAAGGADEGEAAPRRAPTLVALALAADAFADDCTRAAIIVTAR